ncbi:MAG TPA: sensor domain-containing diguanylate cyclase [Polyangiales bacterium]|nr:sensor domain-containing diguanylate cyclase [Polyangiales bacterium]
MSDSIEVLAAMTQDLLDAQDRAARLQVVTDAALRLTRANHASVRLSQGDRLQVGARSGVGSDRPAPGFRKGQGVLGWVAETGILARVDDSQRDPRFAPNDSRGFDVNSLVSVPIRRRGETLGVLSLSAPERCAFSSRDEALATLLAQAAAQALVTSQLEEAATTDAQTLALNHGQLVPRLRTAMERAQRRGEALSVLLIDLDHFKAVNDLHGHAVGDAVLRSFADKARELVRSGDILIRRGGEEFVLIMPGTLQIDAQSVGERIRETLDLAPLRLQNGQYVRQTVSVGVATWDGFESPELLDERADLAMYEAKRMGRNRVVAAHVTARLLALGSAGRLR